MVKAFCDWEQSNRADLFTTVLNQLKLSAICHICMVLHLASLFCGRMDPSVKFQTATILTIKASTDVISPCSYICKIRSRNSKTLGRFDLEGLRLS